MSPVDLSYANSVQACQAFVGGHGLALPIPCVVRARRWARVSRPRSPADRGSPTSAPFVRFHSPDTRWARVFRPHALVTRRVDRVVLIFRVAPFMTFLTVVKPAAW